MKIKFDISQIPFSSLPLHCWSLLVFKPPSTHSQQGVVSENLTRGNGTCAWQPKLYNFFQYKIKNIIKNRTWPANSDLFYHDLVWGGVRGGERSFPPIHFKGVCICFYLFMSRFFVSCYWLMMCTYMWGHITSKCSSYCLIWCYPVCGDNIWDARWGETCVYSTTRRVLSKALYHIKVYRMYQYFGYDMVDDISNQKCRFTLYVSKLIFLAIKSLKILLCYMFANLLPISAIFNSNRNITVHIVFQFKVSTIQYVSHQCSDTEL